VIALVNKAAALIDKDGRAAFADFQKKRQLNGSTATHTRSYQLLKCNAVSDSGEKAL
jgi:hypothetical protein